MLVTGHSFLKIEWQQFLRFVAAVSASCSGDKSDKEESAGGFCGYGDYALRLLQSKRGTVAHFEADCADRSDCAAQFRYSVSILIFANLFWHGFQEAGRTDWSGASGWRSRV